MKGQKKKQSGITLIALVISIIVMLILAGVSINATIGENGIVTKAQTATISQRMASLKEELELNIVKAMSDDFIDKREWVTVLNDNIRNYLPSIEDDEIGKYGIVAGELYYIGEDPIYKQSARNVGLHAIEDGATIDEFVADIESKAIENIVKTMGEKLLRSAVNNEDEDRKGIKLANKQVGNPEWAIITEVDGDRTVATYGTGWYFVEKGTELEDIGTLKNDYIINYETAKAIKFDGRIHTILSNSSSVAVRKGLILNIDPSSIESRSVESFGEGAELIGYSSDLSDAFTTSSFIFDGLDDHINLPFDNTDENKSMIKGFTFEIYGKIKGNGESMNWSRNNTTGEYDYIQRSDSYNGFFGVWNGNEYNQCGLRFGFHCGWDSGDTIDNAYYVPDFFYNWSWSPSKYAPSYKWATDIAIDKNNRHNNTIYLADVQGLNEAYDDGEGNLTRIPFKADKSIRFNQDFAFSVSIDAVNFKQIICIDGQKVYEGNIDKEYWDSFVSDPEYQQNLPYLNTYTFGRCSMNSEGWWHYLKGEVYSLKFYNRGLAADEILANYNASVAYHNILVRGGNSNTGGNTGGSDLSDVETTNP